VRRLRHHTAAEYRLLPDYPFSAALQDAAAAYVALLRRGIPGSKIVLIGDSSGGHLALALARWVRDTIARQENEEGKESTSCRLEAPAGLVLFSVCTFLKLFIRKIVLLTSLLALTALGRSL
jgi:alpha-beta hydrolase superfamily lysophospholipase